MASSWNSLSSCFSKPDTTWSIMSSMRFLAAEMFSPSMPWASSQQAAAREDDILREIRQVNDEIPDEVMSAKIDRIEEITLHSLPTGTPKLAAMGARATSRFAPMYAR